MLLKKTRESTGRVLRGWTSPGKKLRARLATLAERKIADEVMSQFAGIDNVHDLAGQAQKEVASQIALFEEIFGRPVAEAKKRRLAQQALMKKIDEALAGTEKRLDEVTGRQVNLVLTRIATKYALDAVNLSDREKRERIHRIMEKAVDAKKVSRHQTAEIVNLLGTARTLIFIKRLKSIFEKLKPELEKRMNKTEASR